MLTLNVLKRWKRPLKVICVDSDCITLPVFGVVWRVIFNAHKKLFILKI